MKKNNENYLSLTSIAAKKPVYQSIIINDNKNEDIKPPSKYSRLLSERNSQFRASRISKESKNNYNLQEPIIPERRMMISGDKLYRDPSELRGGKKYSPRAEDIEDRDWRRRKIRDKAAELLVRVKSQNYLSGYGGDYLQYWYFKQKNCYPMVYPETKSYK